MLAPELAKIKIQGPDGQPFIFILLLGQISQLICQLTELAQYRTKGSGRMFGDELAVEKG